jgi:hypothetical protein
MDLNARPLCPVSMWPKDQLQFEILHLDFL